MMDLEREGRKDRDQKMGSLKSLDKLRSLF